MFSTVVPSRDRDDHDDDDGNANHNNEGPKDLYAGSQTPGIYLHNSSKTTPIVTGCEGQPSSYIY